jgi:hypothetical protein
MDALTAIGIALLSSVGGALGFIPLEIPVDEKATEEESDGPPGAAIVAVVVGPVVALIALIVGMTQYA